VNGLKRIIIRLFKFLNREHPKPPEPPEPLRPPERRPPQYHMRKVGFKPKTSHEKKTWNENAKPEDEE